MIAQSLSDISGAYDYQLTKASVHVTITIILIVEAKLPLLPAQAKVLAELSS